MNPPAFLYSGFWKEWVMSHIQISYAWFFQKKKWIFENFYHAAHTTVGWCILSCVFQSLVTHMNTSWHTYEWVMTHIWMSHGTHMNESYHTYEWVTSHIWMSHVTHMNESCHTYEWVMAHIWMSHGTHMNESCDTYEWDTWHIWMSPVTHMDESGHTCEWVTLQHTATSAIATATSATINESGHTYE